MFTSGGTESNHTVLHMPAEYLAERYSKDLPREPLCRASDAMPPAPMLPHVVSTSIEHPSILLALEHMFRERRLEYTLVRPTAGTGSVHPDSVLAGMQKCVYLLRVRIDTVRCILKTRDS